MQLSCHGTDVLFVLYQTFVYLSRGKKSDVHFSAHHFYCGMITDWEKTVWRFLWKHFRKSQSLFSIKEIRLCYLFVALCFTIHFSIQSVADKCSIHRWQKPTDSFHPMSVLHVRFRSINTDLGAPRHHWAFPKPFALFRKQTSTAWPEVRRCFLLDSAYSSESLFSFENRGHIHACHQAVSIQIRLCIENSVNLFFCQCIVFGNESHRQNQHKGFTVWEDISRLIKNMQWA